MKYKITIIKYEENKDYEKEMAEWKENNEGYMRGRFHNPPLEQVHPEKESPQRSLEVFLSEEEYEKVK
ncbi:MAG: hypothetical protein WCX46_03290, partial [Candidatus Paceibacterota bacterium]